MHQPRTLQVEFLTSLPDVGPVVMVNLVRFRARSLDGNGSGWDAYSRYSKGDMPLLKKVGGTVLWAGHVEGMALGEVVDGQWDWIVLAHYPSRAAFLEMTTSPEYARINVDRENGVEAHVIFAANQTYSKFVARSLSDLRLIYCAGGKSGPFFPDFSLHSSTMRLEIAKNCPRSPTRLATIAQVRQAPSPAT